MSALRIGAALALVVATATVALPAAAWDGPTKTKSKIVKDPYLAFELRFGPYHPNVDDAVGTIPCHTSSTTTKCTPAGPYQSVFGDDKRFMLSIEVDWQFLHVPHFGSLAVGGAVGYTTASGTAQFKDGTDGSVEQTTFKVFPFDALAVLRVDTLDRDFKIPFVPYVKIGPSVAFWSAASDTGVSRSSNGTLGRGHTFGYSYAIGMQFVLDFLDRQAAKTFAIEQGVKHSNIFAEYTVHQLTGLGQTGAMYVGDKTWNLGLMFEM